MQTKANNPLEEWEQALDACGSTQSPQVLLAIAGKALARLESGAKGRERVLVIRALFAAFNRMPSEFVDRYVNHPDVAVREAVAESTTSPEVVRVLAKDSEVFVSAKAAANPALPQDLYSMFIQNRYAFVRQHLAINSSATPDVLQRIAKAEDDWLVLRSLIGNPNVSPDTLEFIYNRIASLPPLRRPAILKEIAVNPKTPESVLRDLHKHRRLLHEYLAGNPSLPADVLRKLRRSKREEVQKRIAQRTE